MKWFELERDELLKKLEVNVEDGLSQQEANARLEQYGKNEFEEGKSETLLERVLHHLKDVSTIILLIAAGIASYMAISTGSGWPKVIVILSIVVINVILGVSQESKAEKALAALQDLNSHKATVVRDGVLGHVNAYEVVPGDIIELHAGDIVPADARLIESSSLQIEEAPLTGESVPVEKDADIIIKEEVPLGDRLNMLYSGCLVTNGRAKAVVTETGMNTEMGKIAGLLNSTSKLVTPLQMRLKKMAKKLAAVAIGAGVIIFIIGVFVHQESMAEMLLTAVSLSVAAVPETLPVIVTLILAYGVQNMVNKKTIIRRIPVVESIGNTSVICSDKTGTLTQNKMIIQKLWRNGNEPQSVGHTFDDRENEMLDMLMACTNAVLDKNTDENGEIKIIGDPTEASIVRLAFDKGLMREEVDEKYPRIAELPFDSTRKLMTTVHQVNDGYVSITKGAFDRIPVSFTEAKRKEATVIHDSFADEALRVIAIAYKHYDEMPADVSEEALEHDLDFLGMVGMIDPPRPESSRAVAQAKAAGIKTVMITGDHVKTASAIAKQIGILEDGGRSITGAELEQMSDQELHDQIRDISVYARVSPEDKIRIVKAWQDHNEVITMTGDGVNDAPALKAADAGAAMGIAGTDVSKNAADMVITDDNFATIVDAIGEGRAAYGNIRKTVYFLLSVNFAEILIMLIGITLGWGAPLTAVQLLFINVVADGIPGFFISLEKPDDDIMQRQPLKKNASLFSAGLGWKIAFKSKIFIVLTLIGFYIGAFIPVSNTFGPNYQIGITMAFIVLSWASVLNIFSIRTNRSIFKAGIISNLYLFLSALASMAITVLVAVIPPVAGVLNLTAISGTHWLIAGGLALSQILFSELMKLSKRYHGKK